MALLTIALDRPDVDIAADVAALGAQALDVVDSYLGMTVKIIGDSSATLTAAVDGLAVDDIGASVRIPLLARGIDGVGVEFILYAHRPGAFVDLAADLVWLRGHDSIDVELDQHLTLPVPTENAETLLASSLINQAIGVLIGRGSTPAAAVRELDSRAARSAITRADAASRILTGVPNTGDGTR